MSRPINIFLRARRALDDAQRAESRAGKPRVKDYRSVAAYLRAKRAHAREGLLDQLAPGRKCPLCGKVKARSRRWVIVAAAKTLKLGQRVQRPRDRVVALCRSCAKREGVI
jgi:hypothetical protein